MKSTKTTYEQAKSPMKSTKKVFFLFAAIVLVVLAACSDKQDYIPSYAVDLVEVNTNSQSKIDNVRLDDGQVYSVHQSISASTPDTTLRCLVTYSVADANMTIYSAKEVFSKHPLPATLFKSRPTDPVRFISCWRSDRYLNIKIGVLTTGVGTHQFHFAEDSISQNAAGKRTAHFTLLHRRPDDDAESYTDERFLSVPLANYSRCDSFAITINTYDGPLVEQR